MILHDIFVMRFNMITADEARKLAEESEIVISEFGEKIGSAIEKAAKDGKFELNLSTTFFGWKEFDIQPVAFGLGKPIMTSYQERLKAVLANHGFTLAIRAYPYQDGGGLGMVDCEKTLETKVGYHFYVSWKNVK